MGTQLIADLAPGPLSSSPELYSTGRLGGLEYFAAAGANVGVELYRTDGTALGTQLVDDSVPGLGSSDPVPLGVAGGKLLVSALLDPSMIGRELYRVDPGGLSLVADLMASGSSFPRDGLVSGGLLLFTGSTSTSTQELFRTDGTTAGTLGLYESSLLPKSLTAWMTQTGSGMVVYSAATGQTGQELFVTDGLAGGALLADLEPLTTPIASLVAGLTTVDGDRLMLTARAGEVLPSVFQWTPAGGLDELFGFDQGVMLPYNLEPTWFGDHEQVLFFGQQLNPGLLENALYSTDGTAAGSQLLDGLGTAYFAQGPPVGPLLGRDGKRAILGVVDAAHGAEPWVTDGSVGGAALLVDLEPGPAGSDPYAGIDFDGGVFFVAKHGAPGEALWRVDDGVVSLVRDLNLTGSADASGMTIVGGALYFAADDGLHGSEPWISDGTAAGTHMLVDLQPGPLGSQPVGLVSFSDKLHFFAEDVQAQGFDLWSSTGSPATTVKQAALGLTEAGQLVPAGVRLYFAGHDPAHGTELWALEGSSVGPVADLTPGPGGSDVGEMIGVGNRLYFVATTPGLGTELFVSDGTLAGTHAALDINGGPDSSDPAELTLYGGDLFLVATDSTEDRELFRLPSPGASSLDLGFGSPGVRLQSSAPVLGMIAVAEVTPQPVGSLGLLAMSLPAAPTSTLVEPGAASWIDLASFQVLSTLSASQPGFQATIPASPSLAGLSVNMQAWFLGPSGLPAQVSNGLRLVLGS